MKKVLNLLFSFVLILAVSFLVAQTVIAQNSTTPPMDTDIDSYLNGKLNGQDGWSDVWNSLQVQDIVSFEGRKSVRNHAILQTASYKELGDQFFDKGVASFKIKIDNNSFSDNQDLFGLYKGIGEEYVALFRFANNFEDRQNTLLLSIAESADVTEMGQITQGEWHKISLSWRGSDFMIRIKIDNDDWSPWFSSQTTWSDSGPLGIKLALPGVGDYGDFYIDDIKFFIAYEEPIYDPVLLNESIIIDSDNATQTATSTVNEDEDKDNPDSISADTQEDQVVTVPF